jgi:hypothetical protein
LINEPITGGTVSGPATNGTIKYELSETRAHEPFWKSLVSSISAHLILRWWSSDRNGHSMLQFSSPHQRNVAHDW